MLPSLKNHPFAVAAFFDRSTVLTYSLPIAQLKPLLPDCLTLDTFDEKWGFVAMALVQTRDLRPKGFPKFMGNNFFLIGYRIFVNYRTNSGKRLRGLYIIKSETNRKKMEFFGNIFTHYNYTTTDITKNSYENYKEITSLKSDFNIKISNKIEDVELPARSPFSDWKEARRYAGPLPFTFTYNEKTREVLIIEGVRQNWKPKPIEIISAKSKFLQASNFENAVLANAFAIEDIPYYWKKRRKEVWQPSAS